MLSTHYQQAIMKMNQPQKEKALLFLSEAGLILLVPFQMSNVFLFIFSLICFFKNNDRLKYQSFLQGKILF